MREEGIRLVLKGSSVGAWYTYSANTEYTIDITWENGGNPKLYIDGSLEYDGSVLGDGIFTYAGDGKLEMGRHNGGYVNSVLFDELYYATTCPDADAIPNFLGASARYSLNYKVVNPTSLIQVERFILDHCNGEAIFSEGKWHYYVHKARSSVATFTKDEVWDVKLSRPNSGDIINRVRASYIHQDDWREDEYCLESSELIDGSELLSEGYFDFTGSGNLGQVHRLCTYQLNKRISDLQISFQVYNTKGLERFDRFQFTHDIFGLSLADFYVLSITNNTIIAVEYSTDLFSDKVISTPVIPEAILPLPTAVPDEITNLILNEGVYQALDAHFESLIEASWTASVFDWVKHYEIWTKYASGDDYILYGTTTGTSVNIRAEQEDVTAYVKIITMSKWDISSSGVSDTVVISGKVGVPVWPGGASLSGTEAGDMVLIYWPAAEDDDTVRYEIRRGRTTDDWDSSTWIETIDARNYQDRSAPVGTWRYFVKAIDSIGQYTADALTVDLEITLNPNLAFNRDQVLDLDGAAVNQVAISPSGTETDRAFPAPAARTWTDKMGASQAWSSVLTPGENWMCPVPTSGTIDLITAQVDMGTTFSGEFTLDYTATKEGSSSASLNPSIIHSTDGTNWDTTSASGKVDLTARYVKAKFVWVNTVADNSFYYIDEPITINVKAIPVVDFGTATVDTSGVEAISFTVTFTAIDKILLTPKGSSARLALADDVTTSGFNLRLFDTGGSVAAGDVYWKVEGV
ncbi:MAG: hypothetical protein DRI37_10275 [Chloroflexi bacterium]|nr:MAG: hypothetical protein DRI37_10275 [Chloroflexota bacterium]